MATKRQREMKEKRRSAAVAWADDATSSGPSYLKLPKGIEYYQITKGEHRFDLIPYVTKNNPQADKGFPHFVRQFEVYKIPRGDDKFDRFVVPSEFGLHDPIAAAKRDGRLSKEESDVLRAQRRLIFLVNDKPGDPKNPLKVLDAVYFNRKLGFGEQLAVAINAMRSRYGDEFDPSNLDEGMTVQILTADEKYRSVSRIDFLPRKYKYPESVLEEAPCLDDMLVVPDSDDMERLIFGGPRKADVDEEEPETDEPVSRTNSNGKVAKKTSPVKEEEEEEDPDLTPVRSAERKSATVKKSSLDDEDEESPLLKGVKTLAKDDDWEDEDPEEMNKTAPVKKSKKPTKDDDWEDEEIEEDEEDEPVLAKKKPPVEEEEEEEDEDPWDDEEEDEEEPAPRTPAKKGKK